MDAYHLDLLSKKYDIDSGFALATWILETGWGSSAVWQEMNNPAGIVCGGDYCKYTSKEQGIQEMYALLDRYVKGSISYVGVQESVKQVRDVWSETDDTNLTVDLWNAILAQ